MAEANEGKNRPSPDALLELACQEQSARGRLKIFLRATPRVGKTSEMRLSGGARLAEGEDVVIGVVETHGRHGAIFTVELPTAADARIAGPEAAA